MKSILKSHHHRSRALARLENSAIKAHNSLKGFTLIELIMAIVVVGIVAMPVSITLSKHIQSVFDSQNLTVANNLARFDLEQMNNTAYASIVPFSSTSYQGYSYYLDRAVSLVNPLVGAESTKQVTVRVRKSVSAPDLVKLVTYISNNVRYPF